MNRSHNVPFLPRVKIEPKPYGQTAPRTRVPENAPGSHCSSVTIGSGTAAPAPPSTVRRAPTPATHPTSFTLMQQIHRTCN